LYAAQPCTVSTSVTTPERMRLRIARELLYRG
jgi:hypothetical protein